MRQRDPAEREALELLHDGDPEPYLELKHDHGALAVHEREESAIEAVLADWNVAQREHGLSRAVMIARDNGTRAILNDQARTLLLREGVLAADALTIADQEYRVGDRVIARRNDRYRDIDNGTLGQISAIDRRTGEIAVITDAGQRRQLDASYVAGHLEHGYALTGHGAHGATVHWAGVIGRPSEFTREWAYTSLSRAREGTRVYVVAEATSRQREREEYAPPEPQRTTSEALDLMVSAMRRREAEPLAIDAPEGPEPQAAVQPSAARVSLAELAEAGAQQAAAKWELRRPSEIRGPGADRWRASGRERGMER